MTITGQIAKHLRDTYFGGNWTCVNLRDTMKDVTWQQANAQVYSFNSIVTLIYHTNYYIGVAGKVLHGEPLVGKDEDSFKHTPILSQQDWENLLNTTWAEAEAFANLIEQLPDDILLKTFADEKYGTDYRHLQGIVEHLHYHLGQIVLIKKMISASRADSLPDSN